MATVPPTESRQLFPEGGFSDQVANTIKDVMVGIMEAKGISFARGTISLLVSHILAASTANMPEIRDQENVSRPDRRTLCLTTIRGLEAKIARSPTTERVITIDDVLDQIREITDIYKAEQDIYPTYLGSLFRFLDDFAVITDDQLSPQDLLLVANSLLPNTTVEEREIITRVNRLLSDQDQH